MSLIKAMLCCNVQQNTMTNVINFAAHNALRVVPPLQALHSSSGGRDTNRGFAQFTSLLVINQGKGSLADDGLSQACRVCFCVPLGGCNSVTLQTSQTLCLSALHQQNFCFFLLETSCVCVCDIVDVYRPQQLPKPPAELPLKSVSHCHKLALWPYHSVLLKF